ncbi:unnamed protein product [Staurois parvus]|uniref:Uncharacterized protein n=1 Tax=Staurois parvus TaxID=386267 RepID=A0ABN9DZB5_9NEOB|nr:unnamed protein product [Staurois parvus]
MYIHTHTHTETQTHVQTHMHVHTHRHMYTRTHTHTNTTHTQPYKKLQYFITFTHKARYCTLGGGREHSTHSFLCFHFAQLLSSLTAPSASDRSGPEFRACSARWPWGHTRPHHNFRSPIRAGEWKFQGLI